MGVSAGFLGLAALLSNVLLSQAVCAQDFTTPAPVHEAECCAPLSPAGVELIIDFEVGGRQQYVRRYQRPVCPACTSTASGVTIGLGYDLRHQSPVTIRRDWAEHPRVDDLPQASGVGGTQAVQLTRQLQHVITPLAMAERVFLQSSAVEYRRRADRCYPGLEGMPQGVIDAMVSLTYNRGCPTGMVDRGREARAIRDQCIPRRDAMCVAAQIRAMSRIWTGSAIQDGMRRRRVAEAQLALGDAR